MTTPQERAQSMMEEAAKDIKKAETVAVTWEMLWRLCRFKEPYRCRVLSVRTDVDSSARCEQSACPIWAEWRKP